MVQYFKEALGDEGEIHVANSSAVSPAFLVADYTVVTPIIYDDGYIPFLLEYCKNKKINAIISLFDIDLPILARNKNRFTEIGVTVIVSEPRVIDICNDKWNTYKFLVENNFAVPRTYISLASALDAISSDEIRFPLMVKPRWGMGSISVFEAENENELRVFYDKIKRDIFKTYLKYESEANVEECVLIQQKLPGQEYGLDVINDLNGNYQTTIVKQKYAMRSGETDCAVTVESNALKAIGEKLGKALSHIGNLDVDIFMDENNVYILELNARFGGGYPFSHMAGVNLPLAIVQWLSGVKADADLLLKEKIGIMSQKDINMVTISQPHII